MTRLLVIISGELILSQELYIMIIMFQMSFILPKLIVWHDNMKENKYTKESAQLLGLVLKWGLSLVPTYLPLRSKLPGQSS